MGNRKLGTGYRVVAIRYVEDDTPSPTIYRDLALALVEDIARKEVEAAE